MGILLFSLLLLSCLSPTIPSDVRCSFNFDYSPESALLCTRGSPEGWEGLNNFAYAHFALENLDSALDFAQKALVIRPLATPSLKLVAWINHVKNEPSDVTLESLKRLAEASRTDYADYSGAISFENHLVIHSHCNYAGFATNNDQVGGGEALSLAPQDLYLDLLMRQLGHKSVQRSVDLDEVMQAALPQGCVENEDPSRFEAPWDLPFSVLWVDRGDYKELDGKQCTWWKNVTDNCPATTMTASQLLMTAKLGIQQIEGGVEGDFIEAGIWRGGMTTLLRGVLKSRNDDSRIVYAADSFSGIPIDLELGVDDNIMEMDSLTKEVNGDGGEVAAKANWLNRYVAGEAELKKNLRRVGLYDGGLTTRIVKGFFNETFSRGGELEKVAGGRALKISLARLDSDAFDSIWDSLNLLWPHITVGGVVIVDDYHIPAVREAVKQFREQAEIKETAGPVFPISNDYIFVCNSKRRGTGSEEKISKCEDRERVTKDMVEFLELFPTSAFFYKVGGVYQ